MKKQAFILIILIIALGCCFIYSCSTGAVSVSAGELVSIIFNKAGLSNTKNYTDQQEAVIWLIRLPRVCMTVLVGASLALCGAAIQGLFRNPLADPGIIGVSSGAALCASIVIVLAGSVFTLNSGFAGFSVLTIATFLGAAITSFIVFAIAKEKQGTNVAMMLLAGIAINALAGAFTGLLTYLSTDAQLRSLTFWTLGSMGGANWKSVAIVFAVTVLSLILLMTLSKALNALALGETEAGHIGIKVERTKNIIILVTSIAIGSTVAFCGIIGFVGLVIPHILRLLGSPHHRFLLPASALGGAILLCLADTVSRTLVAPAEIPVGIITALVGAPVFLFLLLRQKFKSAW